LKPVIVEKKITDEESIATVFYDKEWAFQVEKYPEFYSAYWPTQLTPSEFVSVAKEMGALHDSPVIIYLKSTRINHKYKFSEVENMVKLLDDDCLFLRVSLKEFDVGWQFDNLTGRTYIGFSSERQNFEPLKQLYDRTSGFSLPEEIRQILQTYGG
jgi:hypothetical protein